MNESRMRRGAKQNRRDARRARKRQPTSTDDDILITIRKALAKHPLKLLGMASYLISWATPELHPSTKDTPEEPRSLEGLISHLAERRCRETTALLAVFAEMLLDDDHLRERCRRESSTRRDHLPKWIVGLQDVEVGRVMRRTDILGDGDELAVGLRLADATELTLGVFLDHNDLSAVTDFTVLADALDKVVDRARENIDPGTRFVDMNPADARSWIEYGLRRGEYLPRSDQWREAQPLVRWAIAQLPDGGTAYERPEWDDDAVAELLNGFFASSAGAPFTGVEYRDFVRQLCDTGCGDPSRWSALRISDVLRYPFHDHYGPLEIALDVPALLRAFVPFAHAHSGVRQDLTDKAIAKIDELSLHYKRELLRGATDYYGDDDPEPPPWLAHPDRASWGDARLAGANATRSATTVVPRRLAHRPARTAK
jgi:hypothetical protein